MLPNFSFNFGLKAKPYAQFTLGRLVVAAALAASNALAGPITITPLGVNDSGMIVGTWTSGGVSQGFLFNPSTDSYTFINPPGATATQAYGINDAGQIVGAYSNASGSFGFLDAGGSFTTLLVPGAEEPLSLPSNGAVGINVTGEIVGSWTNTSGANQGFIYSAGSFTATNISDSGLFTALYGINDSGLISGYTYNSQTEVRSGFIYNGSTFQPVNYPGALQTIVQGINDSGVVVGIYDVSGTDWGFTYNMNTGVYTSIAYPGSASTQLYGISNDGEIVGTYCVTIDPCTPDPAFYAVPIAGGYSFTTLLPTPEPGTGVLLTASLIAAGLLAIRRNGRQNVALSVPDKRLAVESFAESARVRFS